MLQPCLAKLHQAFTSLQNWVPNASLSCFISNSFCSYQCPGFGSGAPPGEKEKWESLWGKGASVPGEVLNTCFCFPVCLFSEASSVCVFLPPPPPPGWCLAIEKHHQSYITIKHSMQYGLPLNLKGAEALVQFKTLYFARLFLEYLFLTNDKTVPGKATSKHLLLETNCNVPL